MYTGLYRIVHLPASNLVLHLRIEIQALRGGGPLFPGIIGYDETVIPQIVNAILAVAAADPPERIVHVSTGNRNPMRYRELVAWTHDYFHEVPYVDEDGQPILPAMWTFPGRAKVQKRLKRAEKLLRTANRVLDHRPTVADGGQLAGVAPVQEQAVGAEGARPGRHPGLGELGQQRLGALAARVAAHVDKVRYNPGHLYHHEKEKPVREKVRFLADVAREHDCAIRVGVNCGSVDPETKARHPEDDVAAMVESSLEHCRLLDEVGFERYVVSLKDSHPRKVIDANLRFAARRPDVPLHLGVTEAGIPPEGIVKTRVAFEQLLSRGVGDTLRVSLTLPNSRKHEEVAVGRQILADIAAGRFRSVPVFDDDGPGPRTERPVGPGAQLRRRGRGGPGGVPAYVHPRRLADDRVRRAAPGAPRRRDRPGEGARVATRCGTGPCRGFPGARRRRAPRGGGERGCGGEWARRRV